MGKSGFTKNHHRLFLIAGLAVLVLLWLNNTTLFNINENNPIELDFGISEWDDFVVFAIVLSLFGEMIPSVAKQFISFGAVGIKLLIQGFSPLLFGFILALGQTVGQMLLYIVGMFVKQVRKGSIGDLASKNHYLHEHGFLIYLAVPFASLLGDAVMLYSGHERINPLKIIPFLFVANLLDNMKWIYTSVIQLEVSDIL